MAFEVFQLIALVDLPEKEKDVGRSLTRGNKNGMAEPRQQSRSLDVPSNTKNKLSFQLKHQGTQDEKQLDSAADKTVPGRV